MTNLGEVQQRLLGRIEKLLMLHMENQVVRVSACRLIKIGKGFQDLTTYRDKEKID